MKIMSVVISRERPDSPDAVSLIRELEAHLEPLYAPESRHGFSVERLVTERVDFFVLRTDGVPAGCGGILFVDGEDARYGEIKRMWVSTRFRGLSYGKGILKHLEGHARDRGYTRLRLETGIHQGEAIGLYEGLGFYRIPPFGPYFVDPVSLCYEKRLD